MPVTKNGDPSQEPDEKVWLGRLWWGLVGWFAPLHNNWLRKMTPM